MKPVLNRSTFTVEIDDDEEMQDVVKRFGNEKGITIFNAQSYVSECHSSHGYNIKDSCTCIMIMSPTSEAQGGIIGVKDGHRVSLTSGLNTMLASPAINIPDDGSHCRNDRLDGLRVATIDNFGKGPPPSCIALAYIKAFRVPECPIVRIR
jgi:hypothetical protein